MNRRGVTTLVMTAATTAILAACGGNAHDPTAVDRAIPPVTGTVSLEIPLAPPQTLDISIAAPPNLAGVVVKIGTSPSDQNTDSALPPNSTAMASPVCAVEATIKNDTLGFKKSSWVISADGVALINTFVTGLLKANPGRLPERIETMGFASSDGETEFNLQLSQHRSDAAVAVLSSTPALGAVPITSAGFGEAFPIADNSTEEGRMQNRRVEMYFVYAGCA